MGRRDQRRVALQRAADGDVRRRQARTVARHAASALHRKQRAKQTAPTRSEAKDPIAHRLWEIEIGENARAERNVAAASEENRAPPASRRSRAFRAVIVGLQTRETTGAEENDQEEARQGFLTSTRVAIDADAPSSERFIRRRSKDSRLVPPPHASTLTRTSLATTRVPHPLARSPDLDASRRRLARPRRRRRLARPSPSPSPSPARRTRARARPTPWISRARTKTTSRACSTPPRAG